MNITQPILFCMLGVLLVLLAIPLQKLIQKTIDGIKRKKFHWKNSLITIKEVTHKINNVEVFNFDDCVGVAAGIASPNASASKTIDGMRYTGGTISFIVCEGQMIFILLDKAGLPCKKFQIWQEKNRWFFREKETDVIVILPKKDFLSVYGLCKIVDDLRNRGKEKIALKALKKLRLRDLLRLKQNRDYVRAEVSAIHKHFCY